MIKLVTCLLTDTSTSSLLETLSIGLYPAPTVPFSLLLGNVLSECHLHFAKNDGHRNFASYQTLE
ncbi:uncharacterized protein PHALS_01388 [Plasmopara halstedii]|uniref:Uncharacterized protein n=1 Tax=Plasmopara halstedii TaxID=4781 RepID=A0A0P1ATP7_PLAHL|nr:uncharacterized protein PHALS_01388 [Plasmopara halstedii]CEG45061.1 hypothetical protein PHALS_01388 [Plasmopara halstedii]|eukprot:XP_024581430.1 hypothetical protein PHALS_01388 [Plasmopara halstedii]